MCCMHGCMHHAFTHSMDQERHITGFNNQRETVVLAMYLAVAMNHTLVLSRVQPNAHDQNTSMSLGDIFDLADLNKVCVQRQLAWGAAIEFVFRCIALAISTVQMFVNDLSIESSCFTAAFCRFCFPPYFELSVLVIIIISSLSSSSSSSSSSLQLARTVTTQELTSDDFGGVGGARADGASAMVYPPGQPDIKPMYRLYSEQRVYLHDLAAEYTHDRHKVDILSRNEIYKI